MRSLLLAAFLAFAPLAAAQTCNYTCNSRTCNPGRAVTGPCFGNFDEAALCGGVAPNCGSSSSGNATAAAYGNMGAAIGVALHDWLEDYSRKVAEKKAFEAAVKRQLELQRAEAERQHKIEEARRLDAMLSYLHQKLKLEGTPQLQLKLGDSSQPNGYGICGLPGVATGGERAGCNTQQNSSGLGLKTGSDALPPSATDSGSKLTLKLGEASEHGIPGLPGVALNDNSAPNDAQKLAANLTPEQAADIFTHLPPEQQQAILARYIQQDTGAAPTPATPAGASQPAVAPPATSATASAPGTPNPQSTPDAPAKTETSAPQSPAMQQLQQTADSSQQGVLAGSDEQAAVKAGQPFDNGSSAGGTLQLKLEGTPSSAPATAPVSVTAVPAAQPAAPINARPSQPVAVSPASIDNPRPYMASSAPPPTPPAPRSPTPAPVAHPLAEVATAEAIASGGLIVTDGEKICDYVQKHCRALVMQNVNPAASMRVMQGLAVPKWMELKGKSSLDPRIDGFIPVDQKLSKASPDPALLAEAQATVDDCLNPRSPNYRCGKKLYDGVWVLTDLQGRFIVADYDPLAFACSGKIESADDIAHRGVGKASESAAVDGLNATGLQLPIQHLAANYSPKCIPPAFPATAFEADQSSGQCRVTSLNSLDELRQFFSRHSIQWDPRWDRQPICGERKP